MPDNAVYYHAAYVISAVLYAGYAGTIWWRARAARRRLDATDGGAEPRA